MQRDILEIKEEDLQPLTIPDLLSTLMVELGESGRIKNKRFLELGKKGEGVFANAL